jgi:hypothetical protein
MGRDIWTTREGWSVGYLAGDREKVYSQLDEQLGRGQWRIAWRLANGDVLDYSQIFYEDFVDGYRAHFQQHPEEADFLTANFSYAYDKDLISREEAFDPYAYYNRPGHYNQIHHAALNIALRMLGASFRGQRPIQVRGGEEGDKWNPGRIMATRPEQIPPDVELNGRWDWQEGSVEHLYQAAKVIQVRRLITG